MFDCFWVKDVAVSSSVFVIVRVVDFVEVLVAADSTTKLLHETTSRNPNTNNTT